MIRTYRAELTKLLRRRAVLVTLAAALLSRSVAPRSSCRRPSRPVPCGTPRGYADPPVAGRRRRRHRRVPRRRGLHRHVPVRRLRRGDRGRVLPRHDPDDAAAPTAAGPPPGRQAGRTAHVRRGHARRHRGADVGGGPAAGLVGRASTRSAWTSLHVLGGGDQRLRRGAAAGSRGTPVLGMALGVLVRSVPVALAIGIAWAGPFEHLVQNAWSPAGRGVPRPPPEAFAAGGTTAVTASLPCRHRGGLRPGRRRHRARGLRPPRRRRVAMAVDHAQAAALPTSSWSADRTSAVQSAEPGGQVGPPRARSSVRWARTGGRGFCPTLPGRPRRARRASDPSRGRRRPRRPGGRPGCR